MAGEDEYCADFMEYLSEVKTCEWCKHPHERVMPRVGLCNHCNRIRLQLKKMEAEAEAFEREHGGLTFTIIHHLDIQRAMVENAKAEGQMYGILYKDDISGHRLERELCVLGGRFVLKEFFSHDANSLQWSFTLNQRRYVFYILSLFNREYMRRNRRRFAMSIVMDELINSPRR